MIALLLNSSCLAPSSDNPIHRHRGRVSLSLLSPSVSRAALFNYESGEDLLRPVGRLTLDADCSLGTRARLSSQLRCKQLLRNLFLVIT